MYQLYMGNKNYSSWSLRPWLLLKHFSIPFEERMVSVAGRGAHDMHRGYSPSGHVPCLHHDGFQVWDSLAIVEYLAERHLGMWPLDPNARARARSISAEMHSGFAHVRGAFPMNIKMHLQGCEPSLEVAAEIARIDAIWTQTRAEYARNSTDKPYLFGDFSIADAMFAPVVWRFHSYNVTLSPTAQAYCDIMRVHPAMREWKAAALAETVALPDYDDVVLSKYGPVRREG